eukprot:scaffold13207_cov143-Cylindrotheca_fusiformis.AAC.14
MQPAIDENESMQLAAPSTWRNRLSFMVSFIGMIYYCALLSANRYDIWTYPILIAASACWFLSEEVPTLKAVSSRPPRVYQAFCRLCNQCKRSRFTRFFINDTNHNLVVLTILIVAIPCSIFAYRLIFARMSTMGARFHKGAANGLGKLGVAAMSYFLIPVSKHSILLEAAGIGSIHALNLHIWAGCVAVFGGLAHGLYYFWIWFFLRKSTLTQLFPLDGECWVKGYSRGCNKRFVNLTGVICGVSFILLALTSIWWVRRNFYRLFYIMHVSFSVILLFGLTMHWSSMIFYLAPSLLYYMASNVPLCVEAIKKWCQGGNGISKVIHIPDSGGCVELSLRMPDLIDAPCGKYVRLCVPEISLKSHPFTVFSHPDDPEDGIVIFRPFQGFTSKLSTRLKETASTTKKQFPKLLINGVHAGTNQLQQALQHDTIVIVAGGVGIVTYISLLSSLLSLFCCKIGTLDAELGDTKSKRCGFQKQKFVHVHWACRDEGLIQHIMNSYMLPLQKRAESDGSSLAITFTVHHTGPDPLLQEELNTGRDPVLQEEPDSPIGNSQMGMMDSGVPVSSVFRGGKSTMRNLLPACTFSAIAWGGLWIIKYCYHHVQSRQRVETRSIVVVVLALWAVIFSLVALVAFSMISTFHSKIFYTKLETSTMDIECADISDRTSEETSDTQIPELPEEVSETTGQTERLNETLSFHHSRGRPDFEAIIQSAFNERVNNESNNDIGIFTCGPPLFSTSIRTQCKKVEGGERCCASLRTANRLGFPAVIYEEVYEM